MNKPIILSISLLMAMIMVSGVTYAQTTGEINDSVMIDIEPKDKTVGPIGVTDELTKKIKELENNYNKIKENFEQPLKSDDKIRQLKSDYIQKTREINELLHVAPTRDFLAEWDALDLQIMTLEEKQEYEYSEYRQQSINELYKQLESLDQQSINSMKLEPAVEKKLLNIEQKLYNKYSNYTSNTYVGENSVEFPYIDYEQQRIVLLIDENNTLTESDMNSISIAHDVMKTYGTSDISVEFTSIVELSCSKVTDDCDPLIGGISLARDDSKNSLAGTVGFRAKDNNDNVGFVTVGHVVQFKDSTNTQMRQPVGGSVVGTIPSNGDDVCYTGGGVDKNERTSNNKSCDFAFVTMKSNVSISDDIYKSSKSTYDINDMAVKSDQIPGKLLKWVGATSGVNTAKIKSYNTHLDTVTLVTNSVAIQGDSGGPVFESTTGARNTFSAKVFGIITSSSTTDEIYYQPTHKIMDELNLKSYN